MTIDDDSVTTLEDLRGDLALRYKWTPSGGHTVDPAIVDADMAALSRDGYRHLAELAHCRGLPPDP